MKEIAPERDCEAEQHGERKDGDRHPRPAIGKTDVGQPHAG
jgi:hypothetical protein